MCGRGRERVGGREGGREERMNDVKRRLIFVFPVKRPTAF